MRSERWLAKNTSGVGYSTMITTVVDGRYCIVYYMICGAGIFRDIFVQVIMENCGLRKDSHDGLKTYRRQQDRERKVLLKT